MADTAWDTIDPLPAEAESIKLLGEATANGVSENYLIAPEQMKPQMELENVDNTSDADKPVSNAAQMAIEAVGTAVTDETARAEGIESDLQDQITAENTRAEAAESDLDSRLATVESFIPAQASADNQLADKDFVNSSVSTNTAYPIGTFNSLADLEAYSGTLTNNDYGYVVTTNSTGDRIYKRYKWDGRLEVWKYEYDLNTTGYTAEQFAALNSGITKGKVDKLDGIEVGAEKNVQSDWNETDTTSPKYIKNKPTGISIDEKLNDDSANGVANNIVAKYIGTFINVEGATAAKNINIQDLEALNLGFTCKVMFQNGHNGGALTLNGYNVYVNRHGSLIPIPTHTISGIVKCIQPYTTLELVFMPGQEDDFEGGWVVIGNPIALSGVEDGIRYEIKSDGFISQSCTETKKTITINTPVFFVIPFKNRPLVRYMTYLNSWKEELIFGLRLDLSDNTKFQVTCSNSAGGRVLSWMAEGY